MSFCFNSKMHGKVRKPLKSNTRSYINLLRAALSSVQNKILRLKSMKLSFLSVLKFSFFFSLLGNWDWWRCLDWNLNHQDKPADEGDLAGLLYRWSCLLLAFTTDCTCVSQVAAPSISPIIKHLEKARDRERDVYSDMDCAFPGKVRIWSATSHPAFTAVSLQRTLSSATTSLINHFHQY